MYNQINVDLQESLKNGDKFRLSVLRMLKSALQLDSINNKRELTDDVVINVLKKQVKQRNDSIQEYTKLNKMDVVENLQKEIDIINAYLPSECSEEEMNKVIDEAFEEIKPSSMKEMGQIMKYVIEKLSNADMSKVSAIVKERLVK